MSSADSSAGRYFGSLDAVKIDNNEISRRSGTTPVTRGAGRLRWSRPRLHLLRRRRRRRGRSPGGRRPGPAPVLHRLGTADRNGSPLSSPAAWDRESRAPGHVPASLDAPRTGRCVERPTC